MGVEFELKYRATPQQLSQLRSAISGAETEYSMHTTYYDTPEGHLSARHYTLRLRMENGISVCTLKTPAKDAGRMEFELICPDIQTAIPELCKLSGLSELSALTSGGVLPICGARFTRIAKTVTLDDCVWELALDQGILYGGGKEIPLCEIEMELKSGNRQTLIQHAALLRHTYDLQPEHHSKFRRALSLYKGE